MEASTRFSYDGKLKNGDNVSVYASGTVNHSTNKNFLWRQISYYQQDGTDDWQNRYGNASDKMRDLTLKSTYTFNFLNGLHITPEYMFSRSRNRQSDFTYRLDRLSGWGPDGIYDLGALPSNNDSLLLTIDTGNSHRRVFDDEQHYVGTDINYWSDKGGKFVNFHIMLPMVYHNRKLHYASVFTDTTAVSHTWAFSPQLVVTCAWNNWMKMLYANYNVENMMPDLYNTIDVRNDTDPLHVRLGNPSLKRSVAHRMQVGYQWRTNAHKINHSFGYGLRFFLRQVSQGYTYDTATGAYTFRPQNVDGNWQTYFWNSYGQTLDAANKLSMRLYTHGDYTRAVDMASTGNAMESRLTHADNYFLEQSLTLNYQAEKLTIGASGNLEWRHTSNKEHTIETISAINFSYGPRIVYTFPFQLSVATDMKVYSRRGYGDASLNTDDWVWNAAITQPFFKGKVVAKLEGFDILGKLSNTHIEIDGLGRREMSYNTLPRYIMLHLVYKFNKLPKNKK